MKKLLIISFDIIHKNEPQTSYSIASLTGYLQSKPEYNKKFMLEHLSINVDKIKNTEHNTIHNTFFKNIEVSKFDFIAISAYVWSKQYINSSIEYLKNNGFNGKIILGGNEITYSADKELEEDFPHADIFIKSYAEEALYKVLIDKNINQKFLTISIPQKNTITIYSSKTIKLQKEKIKVRFETKRGCLFNCSFCAHKEKNSKKVNEVNFNKVIKELKFLNSKNISKVNILDPVFNTGNYLEVLEEMIKMKFKPKISLQTRFELISGEKGEKFLDLCEKLNVILEFGLQTIIEKEYNVINRKNKKEKIIKVLKKIQNRNIDYEVSLIYGLPNQTVKSFKESISFLEDIGSKKIVAFPLMLLKGTKLYAERNKWNLKEKVIGEYNLPYVVSGNTFSESDYKEMEKIANNLKNKNYEKTNFNNRSTRKWENINIRKSTRNIKQCQPLLNGGNF